MTLSSHTRSSETTWFELIQNILIPINVQQKPFIGTVSDRDLGLLVDNRTCRPSLLNAAVKGDLAGNILGPYFEMRFSSQICNYKKTPTYSNFLSYLHEYLYLLVRRRGRSQKVYPGRAPGLSLAVNALQLSVCLFVIKIDAYRVFGKGRRC